MRGELVVIDPTGNVRRVPCSYEGIKDGLGGATFDFIHAQTAGVYLDDEGMLRDDTVLNVPVSMLFGRALYGPAVLAAAQPSAAGDTMPPPQDAVLAVEQLAAGWRRVVSSAASIGQSVEVFANPDRLPPPKVIALSDEQMARWLETGEMPDA